MTIELLAAAGANLRRRYSLPSLSVESDIFCWLRADLGFDAQSGIRWNDQRGNGYNFSNGLTAEAPVYAARAINGHPTLNFDGSNDVLLNGVFGGGANLGGALVQGNDKAFTLFFALEAVSVPTDPANADLFSSINSSDQNAGHFRFGFTNSNWYLFKRGTSVSTGDIFGGSGLTTGFHIVTMIHNGTSTTVRLDGVDDYTVAMDVAALTGLDLCAIGRSSGAGNAANIRLAEFIAADTAFDSTEVNEIEDYLEARYIP